MMAKLNVDALSLKNVKLGLENGQFTAKKPRSCKSRKTFFSWMLNCSVS